MNKYLNVMLLYIRNDRIKDYRRMLLEAIKKGYCLGGLYEFFVNCNNKPFILLRHDVDIAEQGVLEMLRVESELNIKSSWYFRWETASSCIINEIKKSGGEVGLHYETLGALCEKKGIDTRARVNGEIIKQAQQVLISEVEKFRQNFNVPCLTIAAHGHPQNIKIKMANNEIVSNDLCRKLGIVAEAYQSQILDRVECYISDTTLLCNYGWAYRVSLGEAIERKNKTICFLSHPHYWDFSLLMRIKSVVKLLVKGVKPDYKEFKLTYR